MGCLQMHNRRNYAVSEIISLSLTLFIFSIATASIIFVYVPYMNNQKGSIDLENNLLQLDALGTLTENIFNEGVFSSSSGDFGSSKAMIYKLNAGNLYFDEQGTRFVFYYSIYNNRDDPLKEFNFNVTGFNINDGNEHTFIYRLTNVEGGSAKFIYNFYNLNTGQTDSYNGNLLDIDLVTKYIEETVTCNNFDLSGSIRIDVIRNNAPNPNEDYGRIWLFDVGSLVYDGNMNNNQNKIIVENGGVVPIGEVSSYFYNEPRYWNQTLLNDSSILSFKIMQTKKDPDSNVNSISGSASNRIKFTIKSISDNVSENKRNVYNDFKIKFYGNDDAVFAWRLFYEKCLEFEYIQSKDLLIWSPDNSNILFSFNHDICYLSMEVEN